MNVPWSKKHKKDFKSCRFSLSNSFADPLSHQELVKLTKSRNDTALLEEYDNHNLMYTPNGGSNDLKSAIADLYGPSITKDHILVFPGGQVAIQVAAQAFARNAHSIVFEPGYQSTIESPEWAHNSRGVTKLQRKASNRWQIDLENVKQAITPHTKYMVINEPHNPGGIVMPRVTQIDLVELCAQHGIKILSDEVYRLLEHDLSDRIPAMADAYPGGGISCVSMSKPWGACGISVGWLACSNLEMIGKLWDCQYFGTACIGRACELQAIMVLRASDVILADRRSVILANKALLQNVIETEYPDLFEWVVPNAGAIAFVKFKGPLTSLELGRLLAGKGISIKPAYCFSGNDDESESADVYNIADCFRIGFGERKMPLALEAFVKVIEEFKDEWREEMKKTDSKK
jgi:aspartate/methionine/tyrosine aminotransferase